MPQRSIIQLFRFLPHLRYHREILKFIRWSAADARRAEFYAQLMRPGDMVFDVGANFGNRSKIFVEIGANVIAYEPQSYCAEFLAVAFAGNPGFTLEQIALSDHEGLMPLFIGKAHTLSTLDNDCINTMKKGGRFATHDWSRQETVRTITLDKAIQTHGMPAFIKIDVEGHEFSVISGLSQPVESLSLEFASESLGTIEKCIGHLATLGQYEYRLSLGESMRFEGHDWNSPADIWNQLQCAKLENPLVWGDIYARRVQ